MGLETILRGAFAGPPTLLKDIPTQDGKQRAGGRISDPAAGANAGSAPPKNLGVAVARYFGFEIRL